MLGAPAGPPAPVAGAVTRRRVVLGCLAAAATGALLARGRSAGPAVAFHVAGDGDDSADGTSPQAAWRTLGRASQQRLAPGQSLLLRGGDVFTGSLVLDSQDAGDPARPVVVGSYGAGRATIDAGDGTAVWVVDTSGVEVRDLRLRGSGPRSSTSAGLGAYSTGPRLSTLVVRDVEVSGFVHGIEVSGGGGGGFTDVLVEGCVAHRNRDTGVLFHGPSFDAAAPAYAHRDVRVVRVDARDTTGDPQNVTSNSGSGIVLGSVDGGLVSGATAHRNGALCAAPEGPVGIWADDARAVVIEDSVAGSNRTAGRDGGGFDLDQNTSDSLLRRNTSYDNDGPGYMLYTAQDNDAHTRNTVVGNLSVGDARRPGSGYGAITVLGRVHDADVVGNTVLGGGSSAPPLLVGPEVSDLRLSVTQMVTAG